MRTLKTVFAVCILLNLLAACDRGSQRRLDRATFEEESRRREPRRIKEGEVAAAAMVQGSQVLQQLLDNSQPAVQSCCPQVPRQILDSLEQHFQARIRCYSLLEALPATADPLERELLEAYQYNLEAGLPLANNVQAQEMEYFLYTGPAVNGDSTSSSCAIWSVQLTRRQLVLGL